MHNAHLVTSAAGSRVPAAQRTVVVASSGRSRVVAVAERAVVFVRCHYCHYCTLLALLEG